jgi:hypothetical protein
MIPEWAEKFLAETGVAERDPKSDEPVAWGRRVVQEIPEDQFDILRGRCEMACVFPDWFIIEKRLQFADLLMKHGGVRAVGLGPGGGFKWVRFADGAIWGHLHFKSGALRELEMNSRLLIKCDKDGNEKGKAPRIDRKAIVRTSRGRGGGAGRRGRGRGR